MGASSVHIPVEYLEVGTETQLKYYKAVQIHGGIRPAAKVLGVHHSAVQRSIKSLKKKAAASGFSPEHDMTHTSPEGFYVKGVSTLYDSDGNLRSQWVKTQKEKEQQFYELLEAVQETMDGMKPVAKIAGPGKTKLSKDMLTVYPMGDPHIGMYAWAKESGADFDLKIAEKNLVSAMSRLVTSGPQTEKALIVNVGDFFHSDTLDNKTRQSGNNLDVDTRWAKVLRVGLRTMRTCIELALQHHKFVHVINEIGNHDEQTSQLLTLALGLAYENNSRVTFDQSPMNFHYYQFGEVLIGVHHGDMVKPEKLGPLMACDKPTEWAEAKFRYWYTGHIHVSKVIPLPGCKVESFATLAAKDAWTHHSGYRADREMYCLILHKNFGEVERHRVDITMLE